MAKTRLIQTSFASGELSPNIFGRVDREIYYNGASKLRNVYVYPLGGVLRRPGTKYIDNTTSNQACRLVPFQFNVDQTYLLVFTPGEMKVYRDDVLQATVTASPISTLTAAQIQEFKFVQSLNTLIIVHPDIQPIEVLRVNDTTWTPSTKTISNIPQFDFGSGNEDVWSSTRGWPRSVTFFDQRLWFGGAKSRPNTVWGSKIAGFFDFDLGTGADADAIEVTIDDDQVNAVENIFGGRTLQVFTQAAEYFSPITTNRTVTPETIRLERATRHGSAFAAPVSSDGATIFLERSGRVVREYVFIDVEQSYISDDISFLSEHLIQSPVTIALQKSQEAIPGEYSYFVNSDGTIAVLNRRRQQNFIAWTLWTTDGEYEDLVVVGNEVYCVVKREINSSTVRFIERFDYDYYTDGGTIYTNNPATTAWTGITNYLNTEVAVRSSGGYPLLNKTVDGDGEITTEIEETSIEVGLPWGPVIRTMPPENTQGVGFLGEKRRIVQANMLLQNCNNFNISTERKSIEVAVSDLPINFGEALPLFSGWKRQFIGGYSRDPYIEITQTLPIDFGMITLTYEVGPR